MSPGSVNPMKCISVSGLDENSGAVESVEKLFTTITYRILEQAHYIFLTTEAVFFNKDKKRKKT